LELSHLVQETGNIRAAQEILGQQGILTVVPGDWAFARASYSGSSLPSDGESVEFVGKAIFILQREEGGSWKIARYLFNMDAPPSEQ